MRYDGVEVGFDLWLEPTFEKGGGGGWYGESSVSASKAVVAIGGDLWYSGGGKGGFSSLIIMGVLFVGSNRSSNSSCHIFIIDYSYKFNYIN